MLLTKLICEKWIFVVHNTSKYCFCHLLCKSNSERTCEKALHPVIFDAKNIRHIDIGEPSMYINTSLPIFKGRSQKQMK